jgi:tRNA (mo5U34)-methyltransferase
MSEARDARVIEDNRRQVERLEKLGWYHSIELPDGTVIEGHQSLEQQRRRLRQFPIPEDLTGKRVLDIGAWDGWFSFEMERRGAQVLALDMARNTRLLEARRLLGSKIEYRIGDICRLTWRDLGTFDIVLFFGVLYHLKHPLLALENVCGMTREMACIESFVSDPNPDAIPVMEYYETGELRGQLDNWVGPNVSCLMAFTRTAGFARARFESVLGERAHVTAWRQWESGVEREPAPEVLCVDNAATHDHRFSADADDYITFYFSSLRTDLDCDNVRPMIGPFGSRPIHVAHTGAGWQATCKVPPGLAPGWYGARLAVAGSAYCAPIQIAVEPPTPRVSAGSLPVRLTRVTDGRSFEDNRIASGPGACLSVWAAGLPEDASIAEIRVRWNGTDLPAIWLAPISGESPRQINALLPAGVEPGPVAISLVIGNLETPPVTAELVS